MPSLQEIPLSAQAVHSAPAGVLTCFSGAAAGRARSSHLPGSNWSMEKLQEGSASLRTVLNPVKMKSGCPGIHRNRLPIMAM